ncbi:hypothetical protein [Kitasatospora sp. NA04385]|uniref:hypothetical protein n=1 Tax=Kitasatospora sp. NA04385 TaxID=2742135 RepID=UPI001C377EAD|nr:hypothetical protein [Kitasatospora sp. NA04385]
MAVLWSLLLAALLAMLPCTASARTLSSPASAPGQESHGASARPGQAPAGPSARTTGGTTAATTAGTAVARTAAGTAPLSHHLPSAAGVPGADVILCAAEVPDPGPGHGCSSHPFCGPESHLPNAPPQPGTAVRPQLVAPPVTPAASACAVPTGSHHAPDLHVLQVHRS